jgi:DNA recombination protein RmuC
MWARRSYPVFDLGRELYDRLSGLGKHVDRLGRALTTAVSTYNQTVGSLESRVLVSIYQNAGVVNMPEVAALDRHTREKAAAVPATMHDLAATSGGDRPRVGGYGQVDGAGALGDGGAQRLAYDRVGRC